MKNQKKTPFILLGSLLLLWGLNTLAGVLDLYYIFYWYDIMMHTLGGAILGLIMIVLMDRFNHLHHLTKIQKLVIIIIWGIVGGVMWEVFEYVQDVYLHTALQVSWSDTISDLICDTIGATFVAIIYWYNSKL